MIVKVKAFANLREVFGGEMKVNLKEGIILKDLLSPVFLPCLMRNQQVSAYTIHPYNCNNGSPLPLLSSAN